MTQSVRRLTQIIFAYLLTISFSHVFAQDTPKKYALLIGVTRYDHSAMNGNEPLEYPEEDAKAIGKLLSGFGYQVDLILGSDATRSNILKKLDGLSSKANSSGVAIVGLFGHGVEVFETDEHKTDSIVGCFCPFDTEIQPQRDKAGNKLFKDGAVMMEPVRDSLIKMPEVIGSLSLAKAGSRVLLADCCRNMPNRARGRNLGLGANFKTSDLPTGTVVFFGCKPGEQALENRDWKHGAFTFSLIEEIKTLAAIGAVTTGSLADRVKSRVRKLTDQRQTPIPFSFDSVDLLLTPEATEDKDYQLGLDLYHGRGQKIDEVRALAYFRKAAERGHPVASAYVGRSYFLQWGGNSYDAVSAASWYRRAIRQLPELAKAGDAEAQVAMGIALRYGLGVNANPVQAVNWFQTAIKLESTEAIWELGSLYEDGIGVSKDLDEMFQLYRRSAELGNANGMLCISRAYSLGIGTTKDLEESHRWSERASQLGSSYANHLLSHDYEAGNAVAIDKAKAFELMSLAFSKGDRSCTTCYASLFFEGTGTSQNNDKGLEILVNNSKTNASIQTDIASRIRDGRGVEKNTKVADDWDRTAFETRLRGAQAGVLGEQEAVAECYLNGKGTAKDLRQAVYWLVRCAIQGSTPESFSKVVVELNSNNMLNVLVDEVEGVKENLEPGSYFQKIRLSILLQIPAGRDKLQNRLNEFYRSSAEYPNDVNAMAWQIFEFASADTWKDEKVISMSLDAAKVAANKLTGDAKASCLDTVAHLLDLQGDVTAAIKIQEEAVTLIKNSPEKNNEDLAEFLGEFLNTLKAKK